MQSPPNQIMQSMVETKGSVWAWLLHWLPDVFIMAAQPKAHSPAKTHQTDDALGESD